MNLNAESYKIYSSGRVSAKFQKFVNGYCFIFPYFYPYDRHLCMISTIERSDSTHTFDITRWSVSSKAFKSTVSSMLVTDVGDQMCWWQVWDVSDRFGMLMTNFIHCENRQHNDSVTNIWNRSPTNRCHQHIDVTKITVTKSTAINGGACVRVSLSLEISAGNVRKPIIALQIHFIRDGILSDPLSKRRET